MNPVNVAPENCAPKVDDIFTPILPEPLELKKSHLPKLDTADRVRKGV